MLYADDAGEVSNSAEMIAKMMTVVVNVFEAAGFTVSETKAATMLLQTRYLSYRASVRHRSRKTEVETGNESLYTSAALSKRASTSWLRSIDGFYS